MCLTDNKSNLKIINFDNYSTATGNIVSGLIIGFKACIIIFVFIWVRTLFPKIRDEQVMSYCWTILLTIVIAVIILIPCILYIF